jgi:hypothetical protein
VVGEAREKRGARSREAKRSAAAAAPETDGSTAGTARGQEPVAPELMLAEACRIIDEARARGVDLRLTGGLAVRHLCGDKGFLRRSHSDIDLVGRHSQTMDLGEVFRSCGFAENLDVVTATGGRQRQFYALPAPPEGEAHAGPGEAPPGPTDETCTAAPHVDVYLDVMHVDHDVWIGDRIDIDDYAIAPADLLISKLQAGRFEEKDLHDVVALVKDLPLGDADAGHQINVGHIADVCSRDWGLYLDVTTNIDAVEDGLGRFDLDAETERRAVVALERMEDAIAGEEKTFRWRLRARLGRRLAWRRDLEETDGASLISVAEARQQAEEEAVREGEWTGWPGWGGSRRSNV